MRRTPLNTHPGRRCVATITSNDNSGRVQLFVRRLDANSEGCRYAIIGRFNGEEDDAGQYRWQSRKEAMAAIEQIWSAGCWDLRFN